MCSQRPAVGPPPPSRRPQPLSRRGEPLAAVDSSFESSICPPLSAARGPREQELRPSGGGAHDPLVSSVGGGTGGEVARAAAPARACRPPRRRGARWAPAAPAPRLRPTSRTARRLPPARAGDGAKGRRGASSGSSWTPEVGEKDDSGLGRVFEGRGVAEKGASGVARVGWCEGGGSGPERAAAGGLFRGGGPTGGEEGGAAPVGGATSAPTEARRAEEARAAAAGGGATPADRQQPPAAFLAESRGDDSLLGWPEETESRLRKYVAARETKATRPRACKELVGWVDAVGSQCSKNCAARRAAARPPPMTLCARRGRRGRRRRARRAARASWGRCGMGTCGEGRCACGRRRACGGAPAAPRAW